MAEGAARHGLAAPRPAASHEGSVRGQGGGRGGGENGRVAPERPLLPPRPPPRQPSAGGTRGCGARRRHCSPRAPRWAGSGRRPPGGRCASPGPRRTSTPRPGNPGRLQTAAHCHLLACWPPAWQPPPPAGRPAWRPPPQWRKACPRLPPGRPRSGAVQRRDPSCRWHARRGRGGGEGRRGIKLRRGRAAALLCRPLHSRRGAALPAAPTSWGSVLLEREWDGGRCPGAQRSRSGWLSKTSRGQRSGHAPGGRPCPRATRPEGGNDTQTRPPATPDAAVGAPLGRKRGGLHRRLAKKRTLACL